MSAALAAILLAAVATGWFALSLLPALRELFDRTDVAPLQLTRGGGDVRHFAISFRNFVDAELPGLEQQAASAGNVPHNGIAATLRDGTLAWYVPPEAGEATLPVSHAAAADLAERVIVSARSLEVPAGTSLLKELFVEGTLRGGEDVFYRAALVTGDVRLGARSSVLRWIDAEGELRVGRESVLYGRASASGTIVLEQGVRFQRIAAPCIRFEGATAEDSPTMVEGGAQAFSWDEDAGQYRAQTEAMRQTVSVAMLMPPEGAMVAFGRWLIVGDFTVPADTTVDSDLVVSGELRIGDNSVVRGAVKSATLIGGARVIYHGAIVTTSRLVLGAGSHVTGPIVVEGDAEIGADCRVGGAADETTISAVSVRVGHRGVVYGEVWARGLGEIV